MKTSFSRNFSTAATILLLALTVLGASFQMLVKEFLTETTISGLKNDAAIIADLASAYSVAFVGSAMIVFFIFEALIKKLQKEGTT